MSAVYDITIQRGATFRDQLVWKQPNGLPVDLTGRTGKMQIRTAPEAPVVYELTTENGGLTLGGPSGTIDRYIPATSTRNVPKQHLEYDLLIILSAAEVEPLMTGKVLVDPLITDPQS